MLDKMSKQMGQPIIVENRPGAGGNSGTLQGVRATPHLLAGPPVPTAIYAANDSMAIGALSALREVGLRVPDDVAVAGFDDIPLARFLDPPLSSVHVDISALGERATLRLLEAVRDKAAHVRRTETFPTTLVLRRSCGAAAPSSRPTAPHAGSVLIDTSPPVRPI